MIGGAEQHINDGVAICQELRRESALPASDAGQLVLGVLLDLLRLGEIFRAEGFDVRLAFPFEDQRIVAAGSFSKKCHVRYPIPAAHANLVGCGDGVAQASVGGPDGSAKCRISPCCSVGYDQR